MVTPLADSSVRAPAPPRGLLRHRAGASSPRGLHRLRAGASSARRRPAPGPSLAHLSGRPGDPARDPQ
eukprot:13731492-Heterocapsa_arctica.AAC.1